MSIETITRESDGQFAARLIEDVMAERQWQLSDMRDNTNSGYVEYTKTRVEYRDFQRLEYEEINDISLLNGEVTGSSHNMIVGVFSGEHGNGQGYDLLTTFGVDASGMHIKISQKRSDKIDLDDPGELERLQKYDLYGLADATEEEQWQALLYVLCPQQVDLY